MAEQAREFRLDATLRSACRRDIEASCLFERQAVDVLPVGRCTVIGCLQDFRHELEEEACREAVLETLERGADDVRFAPSFQFSCRTDYNRFCSGVQPVRHPSPRPRSVRASPAPPCPHKRGARAGARARDQVLPGRARAALAAVRRRPLRSRAPCVRERPLPPLATPPLRSRGRQALRGRARGHGRGAALPAGPPDQPGIFVRVPRGARCHLPLVASDVLCRRVCTHADKVPWATPPCSCLQEVHAYEKALILDHRFTRRLAEECEADAYQLCRDECDLFSGNPCAGAVTDCLLQHQSELTRGGCAAELARFAEIKVRAVSSAAWCVRVGSVRQHAAALLATGDSAGMGIARRPGAAAGALRAQHARGRVQPRPRRVLTRVLCASALPVSNLHYGVGTKQLACRRGWRLAKLWTRHAGRTPAGMKVLAQCPGQAASPQVLCCTSQAQLHLRPLPLSTLRLSRRMCLPPPRRPPRSRPQASTPRRCQRTLQARARRRQARRQGWLRSSYLLTSTRSSSRCEDAGRVTV